MTDTEFDTAIVTAAFRLAGESGWRKVNVAEAARAAGLSLAEARERFPSRGSILVRFGVLADQAALLDAPSEGPVRDRLFDLLMRRFDVLQAHRAGVKALLQALPTDPAAALLLACASKRSMRWMLQAAGIMATGGRGELQVRGLLAVWLWGVRTWEKDESQDLSGTMAAIDTALQRAEQVASWLHGDRRVESTPVVPTPAEPGSMEHGSAEPGPAEPGPAEPGPTEPGFMEPRPLEQRSVEPKSEEFRSSGPASLPDPPLPEPEA